MAVIHYNLGRVVGPGIPITISAVLTAAGWQGGVQTLSAFGIRATSCGDVSIAQSATAEQYEAFMDGKMQTTGQGENSVTLTCRGTVPSIDIPVEIEVRS